MARSTTKYLFYLSCTVHQICVCVRINFGSIIVQSEFLLRTRVLVSASLDQSCLLFEMLCWWLFGMKHAITMLFAVCGMRGKLHLPIQVACNVSWLQWFFRICKCFVTDPAIFLAAPSLKHRINLLLSYLSRPNRMQLLVSVLHIEFASKILCVQI